MAVVLDASIVMGWLLRSQSNPLSDAAMVLAANQFGWVPRHFAVEIIRALRRFERRQLLAPDAVDLAIGNLNNFLLREDAQGSLEAMEAIMSLARHYQLEVADAAYLELALRMDLPLATRDQTLASAARRAGAKLFAP